MTSSLFGIYNAQRSLLVNQAAINLINNNISNINTEGYSKQRLETSQQTNLNSDPNNPLETAQSGLGAQVDNISRNRDVYLDNYFRKENSTLSYNKEMQENSSIIEDTLNELSGSGLSKSINDFYTAAQNLSLNPTDSTTRSNFVQKAMDVSTTFNNLYEQLSDFKNSISGDINNPDTLASSKVNLTCTEINSKLKEVADLNKVIGLSTAQGNTANGLLDKRDLLLDQLSGYMPISVNIGENNVANIKIDNIEIVKGSEQTATFTTETGITEDKPVLVNLVNSNGDVIAEDISSNLKDGKLKAMLDIVESGTDTFNINSYIDSLNGMAKEFATQVNDIQNQGQYTDKSTNPSTLKPVNDFTTYFDLFVDSDTSGQADYTNITAGNIQINKDIIKDPFKIATASASAASNETGDGSNALNYGVLRTKVLSNLNNQTTESYLNSMVGLLGIQVANINNNYDSQNTIVNQISSKKESTMGVNLDEELTDLVRYQRSYEASAKVLNAVNEALSTIINLIK